MKRMLSLILCICLIFAGVSIGNYSAYAAEPYIGCEMYSSNANPIYAKWEDYIYIDVQTTGSVNVSAVTIGAFKATNLRNTTKWRIETNNMSDGGYLDFEVAYSYVDESGNIIETTTNELTSGVAVLYDRTAPDNNYPTMKVEGADSISVTANASGLEGCVAPAHIKGYNFKLFSAIGTSIG
ncbi:MAG: hypothetical protein JJE29_06670, partial [Peptostreptococcaceae bacterium]|nr:hypothetical protein [Peptostreptococcaceae bacterium]